MDGEMTMSNPVKPSRSALVRCIVHGYFNVDGDREFEIFYQEHFDLGSIAHRECGYNWINEELAGEIDVVLNDIFNEQEGTPDEFYAEVVAPMFLRYYTKETIEGTESRFECWHKNAKVYSLTETEADEYLTKEYNG